MFYSLMLCVDLLSTTMFQKKKVKCIKIDGKTPLTTRQTLVTDFQNNDDVKAAVVCFYLFILCFVTPTVPPPLKYNWKPQKYMHTLESLNAHWKRRDMHEQLMVIGCGVLPLSLYIRLRKRGAQCWVAPGRRPTHINTQDTRPISYLSV